MTATQLSENTRSVKRLPKITWMYWLMIISATTIGETGGDLLAHDMGLGYKWASLIVGGAFVVALLISLSFNVQHRAIYWIVIILTSTAGTNMADLVTRQWLGTYGDRTPTTIAQEKAAKEESAATKPGEKVEADEDADAPLADYGKGSALIVTVLVLIFIAWKFSARSVSIDQPLSKTAEFLYWCAILASSTLGTAFGDFLSDEKTGLKMGFEHSTLLLLGILTVMAAVALFTKFNRSILYWAAIIVTHPLGATAGDLMTKDKDDGGLGMGTLLATGILTAIFLGIALVGWLLGEKDMTQLQGE
jgi:uncharacterized membrane-anchored protein